MGSLAQAMLDYPASRVKEGSYLIDINSEEWEMEVTGELARELAQIHLPVINGTGPSELVLLATKPESTERCELHLDRGDLEAFFFVLDKVIAGADAVSLDGHVMVVRSLHT
jgi:hypothetical protein